MEDCLNQQSNVYVTEQGQLRWVSQLELETGVIAKKMYNYLEREKILSEEQRRKRRICGTKDQLLFDKTILKDCKKRHTSLSMAWIYYRNAYDLVPHSSVNECMEMFGIAENMRTFFVKEYAKVEAIVNGKW